MKKDGAKQYHKFWTAVETAPVLHSQKVQIPQYMVECEISTMTVSQLNYTCLDPLIQKSGLFSQLFQK